MYSNLEVALEVVKGETLHTHNSHDGFWSGLYRFRKEKTQNKAIELINTRKSY